MIFKSEIVSVFIFKLIRTYIIIEDLLFKRLNKILRIGNNNNKNVFLFIGYIIKKLIVEIGDIGKIKNEFICKD